MIVTVCPAPGGPAFATIDVIAGVAGWMLAFLGPDGSKVVYGQAGGIAPPQPGMPSVFT